MFKGIQKQLKGAIKQERRNYKKSIESHFTGIDMKRVWFGMRLMSGYTTSSKIRLPDVSADYANSIFLQQIRYS